MVNALYQWLCEGFCCSRQTGAYDHRPVIFQFFKFILYSLAEVSNDIINYTPATLQSFTEVGCLPFAPF